MSARYLKIVALNNKFGDRFTIISEVELSTQANSNKQIAQNSSMIKYLGNWTKKVDGVYVNGATYTSKNGTIQYAFDGTSTMIYSTTDAQVQIKIDNQDWKEYQLIGAKYEPSCIIRDLEKGLHQIQVKVVEGELSLNLLATDGEFKVYQGESTPPEPTSAFEVGLKADKTEVKEGETVTISISLENLNVTTGEQGIGAYSAKIEYDTEIFEKAVFSGNANWEGSMENGNITGVTVDGNVVKQAETIATLSLTVKENAKAGNTTVTISNFVGSDAVNDIPVNNKSIEIRVIEENKNQNQEDSNKTNVENNTNAESNVTDNNNTNNDVSDNTNSNNNANNNNSNNNGNTDTTDTITNNKISNEQLPQARYKMVLYGVFVAILLVLIVVIYIHHRKVKLKNMSNK